jgi:hypothetical protein
MQLEGLGKLKEFTGLIGNRTRDILACGILPQATTVHCVRFEVSAAVTMKNAGFMVVRIVALVKTDVSKERVSSIISVTRIGELETNLAVTNNRSSL